MCSSKGLLISCLVRHKGETLPQGKVTAEASLVAREEATGETVLSTGAAGLGPSTRFLLFRDAQGQEYLLLILPAPVGRFVPPAILTKAQVPEVQCQSLGGSAAREQPLGSQHLLSSTSALRRQGMSRNHYHLQDHTQARTLRAQLTPLSP